MEEFYHVINISISHYSDGRSESPWSSCLELFLYSNWKVCLMKINDVPCNRITLSNAGLFDSSSSICPLNCLSKRIKLSSPNRSLAFLWNSCGLGALTSLTNNICSVPKTPAANTEVIKSEILHYTEYWLKLWTVIWLAWVFCFKTKKNTCHPLQIGNVSKNYSNTITDKNYTFAFWFDLHTNVYFHKSGFYMWTGDTLDRYFVIMCPDVTMTTCRRLIE